MKLLLNELENFIKIKKFSTKKIEQVFNDMGNEVEAIFPASTVKDVIIAKTLNSRKHPNADTLKHLIVHFGNKELDVVCGGVNVDKNQTIIYAPPGAIVDGVKLEIKKLRGIESNGMILSIDEIGNFSKDLIEDDEVEDIFVFENDDVMGEDPLKAIKFDGNVIDLDVLPNRDYAASYWTMAKEFAAWTNQEFNIPQVSINYLPMTSFKFKPHKLIEKIAFSKTNLYNAKPSLEIKRILYFNGIKPTNTFIDLIKYVEIMTGHKIILLNNTDTIFFTEKGFRNLKDSIKGPVVLAAVSSPLQPKSSNEKLTLALDLLIDKAISLGFIRTATMPFVMSNARPKTKIKLILSDLEKMVGQKISHDDIEQIFTNLHFNFLDDNFVEVPHYRRDIKDSHDLMVEAIRIYGINKIKPKPTKITAKSPSKKSERNKSEREILNYLTKYGFMEMKTYDLVTNEDAQKYNIFKISNSNILRLKKEYNYEKNTIQTSLLKSLIDVHVLNTRNDWENVRLFELGNIYHDQVPKYSLGLLHDEIIFEEEPILATKTIVLGILKKLGVDTKKVVFKSSKNINFNPYIYADIYLGKILIGKIGEIHPSILREIKYIRLDKVKTKLYYSELIIDNLK